MRIGNLSDRLTIFTDKGAVDVEEASDRRFDADPQAVYDRWEEFVEWRTTTAGITQCAVPYAVEDLGAPAPRPRQVFAIGANYAAHASEGDFPIPKEPMVFTKWPSSFTGPFSDIVLAGDSVDWEAELVAVIGKRARNVPAAEGWEYIAGLTVGQDVTERAVQLHGDKPQFSPSKSFPGFSPSGPWLTTLDEFANPGDLEITCDLNGEQVQRARTTELVIPVPVLVEKLSRLLTIEPGDVIFTGTPAGVGFHHTPPRYLGAGDEIVTTIEGIGQMRHRFISA